MEFALALAQLNPTLGDVGGNAGRVRRARAEAARMGADAVMLPELFLSGCPAGDLPRRAAFLDACRAACEALARETADGGPAVLLGLPWADGAKLLNAYVVLDAGRIQAVRFGTAAGPFDPGPPPGPAVVRGVRVGLPIGDDLGRDETVECLAETGAELLLAPVAWPYRRERLDERLNRAAARVTEAGLPLVCLHQVGGQGDLVFDGASFALNGGCALACQMPAYREAVVLTRWERGTDGFACVEAPREVADEGDEADYAACVLGLRDRVEKGGLSGAVLALDGIASNLCAAIAVDALGPERVRAISLADGEPSPELRSYAGRLGIRLDAVPVGPALEGLKAALGSRFDPPGALARGALLAAIADGLGALPLDPRDGTSIVDPPHPAGWGFNPVCDLYRTEIRRLCALRDRWRPYGALGPVEVGVPDAGGGPIPGARSEAARDAILQALLERGARVADLAAQGHDPDDVRALERLTGASPRKASGLRLRRDPPAGRRLAHRFTDPGDAPFRPDPALYPTGSGFRSDDY